MSAGATHPDSAAVESTLKSLGFSDTMISSPVGALSGGWKMKLALGMPLRLAHACMHAYLAVFGLQHLFLAVAVCISASMRRHIAAAPSPAVLLCFAF